MAHHVPPGLQYLGKPALWASVLLSVVMVGSILVFDTRPSTRSLVLGGILVYVIGLTARVQYREFKKRTTAYQLGAALPKAVQQKYPGGLDIVFHIFDAVNNRYPSMPRTTFLWSL